MVHTLGLRIGLGKSRQARSEYNGIAQVQRTMLEIVNQLDGFDSRGNVKAPVGSSSPVCD